MAKKTNITDVAKLAGVSITTVSRVINNMGSVKDENRRHVEEAVKKLKYRPNVSAQRLAGGRINALGLIMPKFEDMFHSYYAMQILRGVCIGCHKLGMDLVFHLTDGGMPDRIVGNVDGMLFADIDGNEEVVDNLLQAQTPFIVMNNYVKELPVNCIGIDNKQSSANVVDHLISLGHRKIAIITGNMRTQAALERLVGYIRGLKHYNIRPRGEYIIQGDFSGESAVDPTEKLLDLKDPPTAIYASSDEMAVAAIGVILGRGLSVPGDISVVGFDDSPSARFSSVPLTTVRQPLVEMGSGAVEILNKVISGNEKTKGTIKKLLPTKLIARRSTAEVALNRHLK